MTNLDSILKSRDITLLTKIHIVKAVAFPVTIFGCESWTIKKAEHRSVDDFALWYSRRLLRVPWTARSNQWLLKEINPEYSLERMMLKLKLQYFGHLMRRTDSLEKNPDTGKDWRKEEKGTTEDEMVGWHHWLDGHKFEQSLGVDDGQRSLVSCSPWSHKESDMSEHWTELKYLEKFKVIGLQDLFKLPSTTLLLKLQIYNMTHITYFWTKKQRALIELVRYILAMFIKKFLNN